MKNLLFKPLLIFTVSFGLVFALPPLTKASCCYLINSGFSGSSCPENSLQKMCPDSQTYCDSLTECPSKPSNTNSSQNTSTSTQTNTYQSTASINLNKYNQAIGLGQGKIKDFNSLAGLANGLIPYLLIFAGLILLGMLVAGGFTMLTGATNKEAQEKGKKTITNALIGFFVIFLAYFIAQALQIIFKIDIVGK